MDGLSEGEDAPGNLEEIQMKLKEIQEEKNGENDNNNDQNKEENQEEDIFKIIFANSQNVGRRSRSSEKKQIECFFKKIDISNVRKNLFQPEELKDFYENFGMFFCYKTNEITGSVCCPGNLICPDCMRKTQKMYNLKPHYLINSMRRICTYRKNKICCHGKFTRIEEINKIKYAINYLCGHSGQCDSCKDLMKYKEKYFGEKLMKKLEKRDKELM